ncbi:DNA cytosine methyltransferase [Mycolicibacter sinensis]|uniref:DNA (cytosine-5-)-methyltransferase n=1 Tax=Mycolicibacter sinensis (strain JDM601) TaxID=875328 RepID=A0A1A2XVD8_MYCSD|nr:DNA cytosine methyltransferase [Mycolicibacter sinensis]OBI29047.1 DNA methyltransferase [Mycolicibacter sinensis]
MTLTLTDLFCGAGGSSTGAVSIRGVAAKVASNHWDRAIETHSRNHPNADHIQADISQIDPRYFPTTDLLWASPSCTNHSIAQGRRRQDSQPDLFGEILPDAAAERSRATMWDVVRFAEFHQYRGVIVENVVDVCKWAPFTAWEMAMQSIGYTGQFVFLNSMHAQLYGPGAPQTRDRWYAVFTRTGDRKPDVSRAVSPAAVCDECGPVQARQVFKRIDRRPWGKYRAQYQYRCPNHQCRQRIVEPAFRPAFDIIDWSLHGTQIGARKRPLAAKTLARAQAGSDRYWEPLLLPVEGRGGKNAIPVSQPARTMTTRNETGLLVPTGGTWREDAVSTDQPMPTRTTRENDAIVFPPFIAELRGGSSDARPVTEPLATVTASGNHHALIAPYYGNGQVQRVLEPLTTVTTHERHALVTPPAYQPMPPRRRIDINEAYFRMLEPREISAAMDFPTTYEMVGTRREQVRLAGNAVTPPAARDLIGLVVEAITGESVSMAA